MKKKFNINEYVWVKLGAKGEEIYLHSFDDVPQQFRRVPLPEVDEDGYSKFQMWEFMGLFGPYCRMGFDIPFGTTIRFDLKDLTD
jgi:hypothetical protein